MGSRQRAWAFNPDETAWMTDAACAHSTVDFFPDSQLEAALRVPKSVCETCPSRVPCLMYALRHDELDGVWGGTSELERRRFRKAPAKTAPSHCRNGHPLTAGNLRWTTDRGGTVRWKCAICSAEAGRRRRLRAKAAADG